MGQYYKPLVIESDGTMKTLYSHDYGNGLKLMEHSYIGNNFVNAVASLIWDQPKKVAWIGDYSNDYIGDLYEKKMTKREFGKLHTVVWGKNSNKNVIKPECDEYDMAEKGLFLVNHTLGVYIDLDAYEEQNGWDQVGSWVDGKYDESFSYRMCINPLPLLTACGNGRGGGDYHDGHPDYIEVGTWAFDEIEVTKNKPNYEPIMFSFTEQHKEN